MRDKSRHSLFFAFWRSLFLVLVVSFLILSSLPLFWTAGRFWPGFFYSPFYTTNLFTEADTPAYQAGLRPEDRVIQAGAFPGQWLLINSLEKETTLSVKVDRPLTLVYELGRDLVAIPVQVEPLGWNRLLEKALPFFLSGLWLVLSPLSPDGAASHNKGNSPGGAASHNKGNSPGGAASHRSHYLEGRIFAGLSALALLAAPDYFLNSGNGLESGFDPAIGLASDSWLTFSGKWSTYLYAPLWKLAIAAGAVYALRLLLNHRPKLGRLGLALVLILLAFDLTSYAYEALRTATYNNPDYIVWHGRTAFWPEWIGLTLLLLATEIGRLNQRSWFRLSGFLLFLGGFIIPTTFDLVLPGPGPQWYTLGLVIFWRTGESNLILSIKKV
jgi:hypothetical protein